MKIYFDIIFPLTLRFHKRFFFKFEIKILYAIPDVSFAYYTSRPQYYLSFTSSNNIKRKEKFVKLHVIYFSQFSSKGILIISETLSKYLRVY